MAKCKRLLALVLSLTMLLQLLPTGALAEEWTVMRSNELRGATMVSVTFQRPVYDADGTITGYTDIVTQLIESGGQAVQPNIPDIEGYAFERWEGRQAGSDAVIGIGDALSADTVFTAVYRKLNAYTVTIRYVYESGLEAANSYIEEIPVGTAVSKTIQSPVLNGFTPDKASVELELPENQTEDVEVTVTYKGTPTTYVVKYFFQNTNNNEYTENSYTKDAENHTGTVTVAYPQKTVDAIAGEQTQAVAEEIEGFTALPIVQHSVMPDGATEVEVYYDRNEYTLTINNDGGTYVQSKVLRYGASLGLPAADVMTKPGYTFAGFWETKADGAQVEHATACVMPARNMTLDVRWTPNDSAKYTVVYWVQDTRDKYDASDAQKTYAFYKSVEQTGAVGGNPANISVALSEAGLNSTFFELNQANTEVTGIRNNSGTATKTVAADGSTVINVRFDRKIVTYNFYNNTDKATGSLWLTLKGLYGQTFAEAGTAWPQAPSSSSGTKYLWMDDSYFTGGITYLNGFFNTSLGGTTVNFYKLRSGNNRVLQYIENLDGTWSVADDFQASPQASLRITEKFQPAFYYYGYRTSTSGQIRTNKNVGDSVDGSYIEIYNKRNSFTLSFANCKNGPADVTYLYEATLREPADISGMLPPDDVDQDYVFAGWYLSVGGDTPVNWDVDTMPASNLQVFAAWVPPTYTVTYHSMAPAGNEDGSTRITSLAFSVEKYNTVITAENWADSWVDRLNQRVEQYQYQGFDGLMYTFTGWYIDPECTIAWNGGATQITQNVDVYAKWVPSGKIRFKFKYLGVANNGDEEELGVYPEGDDAWLEVNYGEVVEASTYYPDGFPEFEGWTVATSLASAQESMVSQNQIFEIYYRLMASFNVRIHYVKETRDGEELLPTETHKVTHGQAVYSYKQISGYKLISDPQVMAEWPKTADSDGAYSVDIYFIYEPIVPRQYVVEYYLQNLDGTYTRVEESEIRFGALGSMAEIEEADKKNFTGFTLDLDVDGTVTQTVIRDTGSALKLYYVRNAYKVTYHYDNTVPGAPELPEEQNALYEATVAVAADAACAGYVFVGWHTKDGAPVSVGNEDESFTMPAGDVALYGEWVYAPITVQKIWKDGNNERSTRPDTLTVALVAYVNEAPTGDRYPLVLTAPDWSATTESTLPAFDKDGNTITYQVEEQQLDGYAAPEYDGYTVTNRIAQEARVVSGTKTWSDGSENHDNTMEVQLTLYRKAGDGAEEQVTADADGAELTYSWNGDVYTFANLPAYDAEGYAYTYRVEEAPVTYYTTTYEGFDIINTRSTAIVTVTKRIIDNTSDAANGMASKFTFSIDDGATKSEAIGNGGSVTFAVEVGRSYTLTEYDADGNAVKGWTATGLGDFTAEGATYAITVTNTRDVSNAVGFSKEWVDGGNAQNTRPTADEFAAWLTLYRKAGNGDWTKVEGASAIVTDNGDNTYAIGYDGQPAYDTNGQAYVYAVAETIPAESDYTSANAVEGISATAARETLVNTLSAVTQVSGTKTWSDGSENHDNATEVQLTLYRKAGDGAEEQVTADVDGVELTYSWDGDVYTFANLPAYDAEGYAYTYRVEEAPVTYYTTTYEGFDIINTRSTAIVTVTKRIIDNTSDAANGMESRFTFSIDGGVTKSKAIGNGESVTFEVEMGRSYTLTEYDADGNAVKGWTATGLGAFTAEGATYAITVTNTRDVSNAVGFSKEWVDGGNAQSTRPTADEFAAWLTLYRKAGNGEWTKVEGACATVTVVGQSCSIRYDGQPAYDTEGVPYIYAVAEAPEGDYKAMAKAGSACYDVGNGVQAVGQYGTIINTLDVDEQVAFTKAWVDGNGEGVRPETGAFGGWLTLYRKAGDAAWAEVTDAAASITDNGDGTYAIIYAGMPQYDENGVAYTYALAETIPADTDYTAAHTVEGIDGVAVLANGTITNTLRAEMELTVRKVWKDSYGRPLDDKYVPASVTATLDRAGMEQQTAVLSAENNWTATFEHLDKYDANGAPYEYIVGEQGAQDGKIVIGGVSYAVAVDGATITNTEEADPSLTVDKIITNNGPFNLNDVITYQVTVTNNGNRTLENILFEDDHLDVNAIQLPEGAELVNGSIIIGRLERGDSIVFTYSYNVTEADLLAKRVVNTAAATADDASDSDTATAMLADVTPHLTVMKETTSTPANGATYALGEKITYKIVVTNDGNQTIEDIDVTDSLSENEGKIIGHIEELKPGEKREFKFEYTVTEEDIRSGKVLNVATAQTPDEPDIPVDPGEEEDPTDPETPHLTVTKESTSTPANGKTYALGEKITYKIVVTNDGNQTIKDIDVTDSLSESEGKIIGHIDELAPGEKREFTFEYTVTEEDIRSGKVLNVATAQTPDDPDIPVDPGEEEDPTDPIDPSMEVIKRSNVPANQTVSAGQIIRYTITVTNKGNVSYHNVVVDDKLDAAVIQPGEGYIVNEDGDAVIPELAVGATVVVIATYQVTEADVLAGYVHNEATAAGDPIPDPDPEKPDPTPGGEDEDDLPTQPIKAVDVGQGARVVIGQTLTYTLSYYNHFLQAQDVVITDVLDEGLDFVSASDGGAYDEATRTVTWSLNAEPLAHGTVTLVATVNEKAKIQRADEAMAQVENRAAVLLGNMAEQTNLVVNPLTPENPEDHKPEKTSNVDEGKKLIVGDQLTYTITYFNHNAAKADVVITDKLDEGVDFVTASAGGVYNAKTHTVTWTLHDVTALTGGEVTLRVKVNETAGKRVTDPGVANTASVQIGHDTLMDTNTVKIPVKPYDMRSPALSIGKVVMNAGDCFE